MKIWISKEHKYRKSWVNNLLMTSTRNIYNFITDGKIRTMLLTRSLKRGNSNTSIPRVFFKVKKISLNRSIKNKWNWNILRVMNFYKRHRLKRTLRRSKTITLNWKLTWTKCQNKPTEFTNRLKKFIIIYWKLLKR